jgi:nicotinamidase-related amidase
MQEVHDVETYRDSGFAGRLGFGAAPALVLIDLVQAYLLDGSPLRAPIEPAVAECARLLDAARAAAIPVIHTCVRYGAGGVDGGVFMRKVPALALFAADADPIYGAFAPDVLPRDGEIIIVKQYASAFFGTSLASTLTALRRDSLIIGGVSTSGCVRATALDACQHGFPAAVVRNAVADRTEAIHTANLIDIQAKYADVVASADAIEAIKRAGRGA